MRVRYLGPADPDLWLDLARRCPYATYFHTPAWATLITTTYSWFRIASQSFRLADGRMAVLPLLEHHGAVPKVYESMVPGVYGGPIAERPLATEEVDAILDCVSPDYMSEGSRVSVFGNPFLDYFRAPEASADEFTHILDLRPGFEAIFRRFHTNHRRSYRYGQRAGLRVERATTLDEYRAYHDLYRRTRARWGAGARTEEPLRLFEEIYRRHDPNVVLWVAKLDETVVAGDLWLYWNRHNVGWHGASDPRLFKKFPVNFLLTEIIRDACLRGFDTLDFNPSSWKESLARFKDSFGARRVYFRHGDRRGSRRPSSWRKLARMFGRFLRGGSRRGQRS